MTVKYLGSNCTAVGDEAFHRAGVDPATHEILTWHQRAEISRARAEGRIVAEFSVRSHDPACYVVKQLLPALYAIDGYETTLADLLAANTEDPIPEADVAKIKALPVGGSMILGGGANAELTIERVR
jgi:hypothetical protein